MLQTLHQQARYQDQKHSHLQAGLQQPLAACALSLLQNLLAKNAPDHNTNPLNMSAVDFEVEQVMNSLQ